MKTPSSFETTKNKTVPQKNRRLSTPKKTAPRLADDSIEVLPWTLAILLSTIQAQPQRSKPQMIASFNEGKSWEPYTGFRVPKPFHSRIGSSCYPIFKNLIRFSVFRGDFGHPSMGFMYISSIYIITLVTHNLNFQGLKLLHFFDEFFEVQRQSKFGAAWILVTGDTNVAHIQDAVGGSV